MSQWHCHSVKWCGGDKNWQRRQVWLGTLENDSFFFLGGWIVSWEQFWEFWLSLRCYSSFGIAEFGVVNPVIFLWRNKVFKIDFKLAQSNILYLAFQTAVMNTFASWAHKIGFLSTILAKNVHNDNFVLTVGRGRGRSSSHSCSPSGGCLMFNSRPRPFSVSSRGHWRPTARGWMMVSYRTGSWNIGGRNGRGDSSLVFVGRYPAGIRLASNGGGRVG